VHANEIIYKPNSSHSLKYYFGALSEYKVQRSIYSIQMSSKQMKSYFPLKTGVLISSD